MSSKWENVEPMDGVDFFLDVMTAPPDCGILTLREGKFNQKKEGTRDGVFGAVLRNDLNMRAEKNRSEQEGWFLLWSSDGMKRKKLSFVGEGNLHSADSIGKKKDAFT